MDPSDLDRIALAESFLQEAVYRSRGDQAGATLLAAGSASCGLGEKPSVVLDLSLRGQELFQEIFGQSPTSLGPAPLSPVRLDALKDVMGAWVKRQDGLDRQRNHFMKDFRNANGFDRNAYSDELRASFEAGLDEVNGKVTQARREAAQDLLSAAASAG